MATRRLWPRMWHYSKSSDQEIVSNLPRCQEPSSAKKSKLNAELSASDHHSGAESCRILGIEKFKLSPSPGSFRFYLAITLI